MQRAFNTFTRSVCVGARMQPHVAMMDAPAATHVLLLPPPLPSRCAGSSGYTPLLYAARAGRVAAVRLLLDKGARVDAATRSGGSTSLMRAAHCGHGEVARIL